MGNADFAIPSIARLHSLTHEVVAAVTNPDKQQGRGRNPSPTPVALFARKHNISTIQPDSLKNNSLVSELMEVRPHLFVVVAFKILPPELLIIPEYGCVNLHGSLLPKYRGAAPIQWALMNGDSMTGLTTFILSPSVDTGDILLKKEVVIFPDDDFGSLSQRMSQLGASLLVETIRRIDAQDHGPFPQDSSLATKAPKIRPDMCRINWDRPAREVRNQIRALSPVPGAYTVLRGRRLKLFRSIISGMTTSSCGEIVLVKQDRFVVSCSKDSLEIQEVQLEGKRRMPARDFLLGSFLSEGERLGV
ncbi:MAG: methionyl-tRNA formyltransferase [Candidatus Neomarinimicrobiota bacterium]